MNNKIIQSQVIELMLSFLGDNDPRVRQGSAESLVKIIPKLYFVDFPFNDIKWITTIQNAIFFQQVTFKFCLKKIIFSI